MWRLSQLTSDIFSPPVPPYYPHYQKSPPLLTFVSLLPKHNPKIFNFMKIVARYPSFILSKNIFDYPVIFRY